MPLCAVCANTTRPSLRPACSEECTMMKKSTFGVALAFIAAAAGVLTAVALYLRRREKELDEYERLLYSDNDFEDEDEDTIYEPIETEEPKAKDGEEDEEISF